MFNNTVSQVLLPHTSDQVMTACGVESPGECTSVLTVGTGGSDITAKASATLIGLCLFLLSVLVSQL